MGTSGDYTELRDGTVRLDMSDGSSTRLSGWGDDSVVLEQTTPQGDIYSQFDAQHNPRHVQFHDGSWGDYHDAEGGTVRLEMSDGSSTRLSGWGDDSVVLEQTTPQGDVYSQFDAQHNPRHVQFHDGSWGDYHDAEGGTVRLEMSDGSSTRLSGWGDDSVVLEQTTPQGDVYSQFDAQHNPHHVEFADHGGH